MTSVTADPSASAGARAERAARLADCLDRARNGEPRALDEMVGELNPLLWHVARCQGLDVEEAADVVQTTWLELLQRLREIRTPQALTSWLVTVTRREAWRVRTRRRREVPKGVDLLTSVADDAGGPAEQLISDERDRVLWRHFRRLPPRCRELLQIVALVERPDYAAVAEALGMPRGSIGPTRGRCLAKLRQLMEADRQWNSP